MGTLLKIEGFPATSNKVKVDLFLKKTAKECSVTLIEVKYYHTFADLHFACNEDAENYKTNLPPFLFGGQRYALKASIVPKPKENNWINPAIVRGEATDDADSTTSPRKTAGGEFDDCLPIRDEEPENLPSPKVDFLKVHTWFDLNEFPNEHGLRAVLVQSHDTSIGPDQLMEHFQSEKASGGGPIKEMLLMMDGILIIFHHSKVAERVLGETIQRIDGHPVKLFSKDIPEIYADRLILKIESNDSLPEDEMKMEMANLSPNSTSPEKVSETERENVLLVTYNKYLDDKDFQGLLQKAKEREFDETSKILPLPRTDCIIVEGMPENIETRRLKIRLENKAYSDGAVVTRTDRLKNGLVLIYFASFKHAEDVIKQYGTSGMNAFDSHLTLKPYFHCFSNSHTLVADMQKLDEFSAAMFEKAVAPMSFEYADAEEEILTFVASRRTHMQKLRNVLLELANVEIPTDSLRTYLNVKPISGEVAKNQVAFKELCSPILRKFFAQYGTKTHEDFNLANLKKVRDEGVDHKLDVNGMDDVDINYRIKWKGNEKQILTISGVSSEVDTIMMSIISLVDIENQNLPLTKGRYNWLIASGELNRLTKCNPCTIKRDDGDHVLNFSGSKADMTQAHLDLWKTIEPVKDERFDSLDDDQAKFLRNPKFTKRIISNINSNIDKFKATFTVEDDTPRIWCPEDNVNNVVVAIRKMLKTDKTMQLTCAQRDATKHTEWDKKQNSLQTQHLVAIQIQNLTIVLVGFEKSIDAVKQKIKTFLDEFTVQKTIFRIGYGKAHYILKFRREVFKSCSEVKHVDIGIENNPFSGIYLKGRKNPVEKVYIALTKLNIFEEKRTWEKFGIYEYFETGRGKTEIANLMDRCFVLIGGTFPTEIAEATKDTTGELVSPSQTLEEARRDNTDSADSVLPKDKRNITESKTDAIAGGSFLLKKEFDQVRASSSSPLLPPLQSLSQWKAKLSSTPKTIPGTPNRTSPNSVWMSQFTVTVRKGDITDERNDAIVNSIGNNFSLSNGLVSRQILKKGGEGIQKELEKISGSAMRVTGGGNLPTQKIIHVVFPNTSEKMTNSIQDIISRADEEKCSSISVPALGTGDLKLPSQAVAKLMREAFTDYVSKNPPTKHLKKVDVIIFDEKMYPDFVTELTGDVAPKKSEDLANTISIGTLKLTVRKGDLTEEKSDAIVNSTGSNFDLSQGQISQHIIRKGGKEIQNELSKKKESDMRVTSGGKLSCRKIIHVVFPNAVDKMKECLKKIIQRAEMENCASLAFPAIGTGNLNLASDKVAKCIREALNEYVSGNSGIKNLQHILIVIFEEAKLSSFLQELVTIPSGQVSGAVPKKKNSLNVSGKKMKKGSYFDHRFPVQYKSLSSNSVQMGPLAVTVRKGNITDETSDAIVNSTGKDFNLSQGMVSNQIVKKGGIGIQKELSQAVGASIRVTSGGKLRCGKIIHVVSPEAESKMMQCLKNLLLRADEEKCKSISIPAIGTGNLKMPSDAIAKDIRQALDEYASENPSPCYLQRIDVVIFDEGKYKAFLDGLITCLDSPMPPRWLPRSHIALEKHGDDVIATKRPIVQSSITLFFYSQKMKKITAAIKTIQSHIDLVFEKKTLPISEFDEFILWESESLQRILKTHKVGSTVDKTGKKIILSGKKDDIAATERDILQIASKLSEAKQNQSLALYQWKYCTLQNQWEKFPPLSNQAAEKCYKEGKKGEVPILLKGKKVNCILDPEELKVASKDPAIAFEYNVRRDIIEEFPQFWDAMDEQENYKQVKLDVSNNEYTGVKNKLASTVPNCTVNSICRIQNKKLYLRYQQEKKRVGSISSASIIERDLFHGTTANTGDEIADGGFDRGFAGESNAAVYGKGAYFALNASYSDDKKYATPDKQGVKTLLLANVISGDFCQGSKSMKAPPQNPSTKEPYNCAVNDTSSPSIFVVFVDFGAYPAYVIKYTT